MSDCLWVCGFPNTKNRMSVDEAQDAQDAQDALLRLRLLHKMTSICRSSGPFPYRLEVLSQSIERLAFLDFPQKLYISTLRDVFLAFFVEVEKCKKRPVLLSHTLSDEDAASRQADHVFFQYEECRWKAEVSHRYCEFEDAKFGRRVVYFVNVALPNDSFLYLHDYLTASNVVSSAARTVDCAGWEDLVKTVGLTLLKYAVGFGKPTLSKSYSNDDQQTHLQFFSSDGTKCFSIRWHYGTCDDIQRNIPTAEKEDLINSILSEWN